MEVASGGAGRGRDDDLGEVILVVDQVELGLVRVVVVVDVGVGDGDFRVDFAVQELVDGKGAAKVVADAVEGVI